MHGYQSLDRSSTPRRTVAAAAALIAVTCLGVQSSRRSSSQPRPRQQTRLARQANAWGQKYSRPLGDDLVQHNWPGLQCVMDDDDRWEWGADTSSMACVAGDSWTCLHTNFTEIEAAVCGHTCNATDEARIREINHNSSLTLDEVGGMVGYSYLAVCEWEAVKHLPLLCNGSFYGRYGGHGYFPDTPSNNLWPDYWNSSNNTNGPRNTSDGTVKWSMTNLYFNSTQWDHCNVHAFCWTCADPDGSLNEYCEAALQRYDWWHTQSNAGTAGHTPSPAKTMVFDNLAEYWCTAPVLDAIETGRYKELLHKGVL